MSLWFFRLENRRLADVRTAPAGVWRQRREGVFQALDELDDAAGTA